MSTRRPRTDVTPVATLLATSLLGPIGTLLLSAAIMTSVFGSLNGNLLVGPRLLFAMGEDGLAPRALGEVHPRYRTPALAVGLADHAWSMHELLGYPLYPPKDPPPKPVRTYEQVLERLQRAQAKRASG